MADEKEIPPADGIEQRSSTASEALAKVETTKSHKSRKASVTRIPSALPAEDEEIEYPGPFKLFLIMAAIMLAIFLVALDQTIIATAIPRITDDFHSLDDIGWYGSAYLLTTCSFQLFFGRLYTFFPIKWVYLIAIAIFELGSLICGVAPNSPALIVGRAIAGLGCSGIFSGSLLVLAYSVPLQKRPTYAGIAGSVFGLASFCGPLLGGVFTDHATWRWCFYINLPIGGLTMLAIMFFFTAPKRKELAETTLMEKLEKLDFPGLAAFLPGIICILLALQWGGTKYAWGNGRIIALFVVGFLCLAVFVALQPIRGEQGTLPPRVLKNRTVWASSLYSTCIGGAFFILVFYIPIWFQAIQGVSATASGVRNLALLLSLVVAVLISGIVVSIVGYYTQFMIIGAVILAIGAGMLTTWDVDIGHSKWIGFQILAGFGVGLGLQQPMIAVQAALPIDDVPTATAIVVFGQSLGGAVVLAAATNVFNNLLIKKLLASVPNVPDIVQIVLETGATQLKTVIGKKAPDALPAVLQSYNDSVTQLFFGSVALGAIGLIFAMCTPWISVKGKKIETVAA